MAGLVAVLVLALGIMTGCVQSAPNATSTDANAVSEQRVGDVSQSLTDEASKQLEAEMSAFELTALQREQAKGSERGYEVLDAGRGNPNWINAKARRAYARLMEFATIESERDMSEGDMAGHAQLDGIGERFSKAMDASDETDAFLLESVAYCVDTLGMNKDALVFELVNGIVGDYYPSPSRCLSLTEKILGDYLQSVLYDGEDLKAQTEIFPTEGGSAAMCYVFDSLNHNKVLKPGDKIAIATPIFTPYLEIPHVNDYGLVSVNVSSGAEDGWDIPADELAKLEDPTIKAFFLVNPSNPASHALSDQTIERLAQVVEKNPNLIILTDDVYGTFVSGFRSVYSRIPHNAILVYSFSKLYGVTGWRVGLIAMHEQNVVDRLISELPQKDADALAQEYSIVMPDVSGFKFIDRMCADSRSIGLYHTSGLATPAQVFMDVLALTHLVDAENDPYIELSNRTVNERYKALMDTLGLPADESDENAKYYTLVDVNDLAKRRHGEGFAVWMAKEVDDVEFLEDLAVREGVVLMNGPGFDAPASCVRVSLANLNKDDYVEIARRMNELLDDYYAEYEKTTQPADAA